MALYHASTKSLSRAAGRSAVAAAAYRAGVALLDTRQGLRHDYGRRRDVLFAEVITPDGEAVDREVLWNSAEAVEKRKDARTAREWELALPAELPEKEQKELARAFAQHLVERYGVAVDLAIHAPHGYGDNRNVHAHLLCTTRKFGRMEGGAPLLGEKVSIELSDSKKRALGLPKTDEEIKELRRVWAELTNGWLERNGIEARVDHRSHAERGIDQEPTFHLGPEASAMERDGVRTRIGEENRAIVERNAERARQEAKERRLAQEIEALEGERQRLQGIREAAWARQARRDVEAIRGRWEARTRERRRRRVLERAQDRHANRDHTHDARLWTQMRWQGRQWEREQRAQFLEEERRLAAIEEAEERKRLGVDARKAEIAQEVGRAAILAEWMREHPRQAKAQRLAGGKLPGMAPEGLDRQVLRRQELWQAAEAWLAGRYGSKAEYDAIAVGEGIPVEAAKAGRDAAYNAWAREGLTLRAGKAAPKAERGLQWTLSDACTREDIEATAQGIRWRRERSGSGQRLVVSFAPSLQPKRRVFVLEHLLRQEVALEEQSRYKVLRAQAQRRIETHEPDGREQVWYAQERERKRKAREEQRRRQREQERERLERIRQADAETEREQRPGIRHPEKPTWQVERERVLLQAYGKEVAERLGRWYRITRESGALVLQNQQATLTDYGDRVTAAQGNDQEIKALVLLARAKDWETVTLTGSAEFQEKAGRAFLEAGMALSDKDLQARLERRMAAERERQEILEMGRELCEFADHPDRRNKDLSVMAVDLAIEYGMEEQRLAGVLLYLVNERGRGPGGVGLNPPVKLTPEKAVEIARAAEEERLRREVEQARAVLEVSSKSVARQPLRSAPKKEQGQEQEPDWEF